MPLYDYECSKCGTIEEVQHTVSEIGKIEILCNDCNLPMKKMLSVPALIGFDNVGRSKSRKDKEGSTVKESPKNDSPKKETSSNSGSPR